MLGVDETRAEAQSRAVPCPRSVCFHSGDVLIFNSESERPDHAASPTVAFTLAWFSLCSKKVLADPIQSAHEITVRDQCVQWKDRLEHPLCYAQLCGDPLVAPSQSRALVANPPSMSAALFPHRPVFIMILVRWHIPSVPHYFRPSRPETEDNKKGVREARAEEKPKSPTPRVDYNLCLISSLHVNTLALIPGCVSSRVWENTEAERIVPVGEGSRGRPGGHRANFRNRFLYPEFNPPPNFFRRTHSLRCFFLFLPSIFPPDDGIRNFVWDDVRIFPLKISPAEARGKIYSSARDACERARLPVSS